VERKGEMRNRLAALLQNTCTNPRVRFYKGGGGRSAKKRKYSARYLNNLEKGINRGCRCYPPLGGKPKKKNR